MNYTSRKTDLTIQCCPQNIKQSVIIDWFSQEFYRSTPQRLDPHLLVA